MGAALIFLDDKHNRLRCPEFHIINFFRLQIVIHGEAIFTSLYASAKGKILSAIEDGADILLAQEVGISSGANVSEPETRYNLMSIRHEFSTICGCATNKIEKRSDCVSGDTMTAIPETLTRHFYVLDEVIGGLRSACIAGRGQEAAFWLQELIDSEDIGWAVATLVETCLLYYGVRGIGWLREAYSCFDGEEIGVDELHAACADLCALETQDHSLIALQLLRPHDLSCTMPPDYITVEGDLELRSLHRYFMAALNQGKVRAAYWAAAGMTEAELEACISRVIDPERLDRWTIIRGLRRWACINFSYDSLIALSLMMVCAPAPTKTYNFRTVIATDGTIRVREPWRQVRAEWESVKGRRARRCMQPHWTAFYLETRRGRMSYHMTTITELRSLGLQWDTIPRLSGFWRQLVDDAASSDPDTAWELFCQRAFPDDIPDEWSAADQAWSHGPGKVGQAECNANVAKWLWRFSLDKSYYTYGMNFKDIITALPLVQPVPPETPWSAIAWLASLKAYEPTTFRMPSDEYLLPHTKLYVSPAMAEDQEMNNLSAIFIRRATIKTS